MLTKTIKTVHDLKILYCDNCKAKIANELKNVDDRALNNDLYHKVMGKGYYDYSVIHRLDIEANSSKIHKGIFKYYPQDDYIGFLEYTNEKSLNADDLIVGDIYYNLTDRMYSIYEGNNKFKEVSPDRLMVKDHFCFCSKKCARQMLTVDTIFGIKVEHVYKITCTRVFPNDQLKTIDVENLGFSYTPQRFQYEDKVEDLNRLDMIIDTEHGIVRCDEQQE